MKYFKIDTFWNFGKGSESVGLKANNDLQEDLKIFKSDTFENYKSFVPVEKFRTYVEKLSVTHFPYINKNTVNQIFLSKFQCIINNGFFF